jgi:hypothetical protein
MTAVIQELLECVAKSPDVWFTSHAELARWALGSDIDEHNYRGRYFGDAAPAVRTQARA